MKHRRIHRVHRRYRHHLAHHPKRVEYFGDVRQTKPLSKSRKKDKARLARPTGWRKSKSGRWYTEFRGNRSDRNKKTRL